MTFPGYKFLGYTTW